MGRWISELGERLIKRVDEKFGYWLCNNFGKRLGEKLNERLNEGLGEKKALKMLYECFKYALDDPSLVAASES